MREPAAIDQWYAGFSAIQQKYSMLRINIKIRRQRKFAPSVRLSAIGIFERHGDISPTIEKPTDRAVARLGRLLVMSRKRLASSLCRRRELRGFLAQSWSVLRRSVSFSKVSRAVFQSCAAHAEGAGWSVSCCNSLTPWGQMRRTQNCPLARSSSVEIMKHSANTCRVASFAYAIEFFACAVIVRFSGSTDCIAAGRR
jgi:hypothetical protein